MSEFTVYIFKILAVTVILAAMIFLLFGINRLIYGGFRHEREETDSLKRELKDSEQVITRHNLFHNFLSNKNR